MGNGQSRDGFKFYDFVFGIVTFKKAIELKQVAQQVPLDFMLVETDAPFLTPEPFRGKSNEPSYVYYIAKNISELRNNLMKSLLKRRAITFFNCSRMRTMPYIKRNESGQIIAVFQEQNKGYMNSFLLKILSY